MRILLILLFSLFFNGAKAQAFFVQPIADFNESVFYNSQLFHVKDSSILYHFSILSHDKETDITTHCLKKERIIQQVNIKLTKKEMEDEIYRGYKYDKLVKTQVIDSICYFGKGYYPAYSGIIFSPRKTVIKIEILENPTMRVKSKEVEIDMCNKKIKFKNESFEIRSFSFFKCFYDDNTNEIFGSVNYSISEDLSFGIDFIIRNGKIIFTYEDKSFD